MSLPTEGMTSPDLGLAGETVPPAESAPPFTGEHPPPLLVTSSSPPTEPPSRGATRVEFDLPHEDLGRSTMDPQFSSASGTSGSRRGTTSPPFGPSRGSYTLGDTGTGNRAFTNPGGEFLGTSNQTKVFEYNTYEVEQELEDFGTEYVRRKYSKKIGPANADKLMDICEQMFFLTRGYEPPNMTLNGQELLAELEAAQKKRQTVIGGHGRYYQPERSRNFGIDHDLAFEQEIYLTYTRDHDDNPLYKKANAFEPYEESGAEIYVAGWESGFDSFLKEMHDKLMDPRQSADQKLLNLANSLNPAARQRFLDNARNTDLKMEEVESKIITIDTPRLKANGDPSGEINDKTFRDIRGRLGDRTFDGRGDLSCTHYMEELKSFLQSRFNPAAAFAIIKATTSGEPYQFTADQQKTGVSFHYYWDAFGKLFSKYEDPQIALAKLHDLRSHRPTNLSSRLVKIQNLAGAASYTVQGPTRRVKMVQLLRDEIIFMLGAWFPHHRKQILLNDKKQSARWRAERTALRNKGMNPDLHTLRSDYHPSNSLISQVLLYLQEVEPEEKPKGYMPRYSRGSPPPVVKKNKRRPGVFAVRDEDEGLGDDLRDEECILNDYAESLADSEILSDEGFSDLEGECEVSSGEEADDPEVDALHQRPGEVMRKFQQGARPRENFQDRPPRDKNRAFGREDGKPRPPRPTNDRPSKGKINERFPNFGKNIVSRLCKNCLYPSHDWQLCGVYSGKVPGDIRQSCCGGYHVGPCLKDKAKELEEKKRARAAERQKKGRD